MCIIHSKDTIGKPLFSTSPTNTENSSSLILLQYIRECIREPRHIGPLLESPWTFMEDHGFKAQLESVGGAVLL
jgi:hypothetical protein